MTPQRQVSVSAAPQQQAQPQLQQHVGGGDAGREPAVVAASSQPPRREQPATLAQQPQATSMFIPQIPRGSPNPSIPPATTTTAINLSATFAESRTQERYDFGIPGSSELN